MYAPHILWIAPFVLLLLVIAVLPLVPAARFWHRNRYKLLAALLLSVPVVLFYGLVHPGLTVNGHVLPAGPPVLGHVLSHTVVGDYIPFIVLLFSLYTISGGIRLTGDVPAHPRTNTVFLAVGAVLASFIGTTGAAMLLIRPLLA